MSSSSESSCEPCKIFFISITVGLIGFSIAYISVPIRHDPTVVVSVISIVIPSIAGAITRITYKKLISLVNGVSTIIVFCCSVIFSFFWFGGIYEREIKPDVLLQNLMIQEK